MDTICFLLVGGLILILIIGVFICFSASETWNKRKNSITRLGRYHIQGDFMDMIEFLCETDISDFIRSYEDFD